MRDYDDILRDLEYYERAYSDAINEVNRLRAIVRDYENERG